ncbi:hypothetical protein SK128_005581, partial [Halocaridina rubra]
TPGIRGWSHRGDGPGDREASRPMDSIPGRLEKIRCLKASVKFDPYSQPPYGAHSKTHLSL